MFVLFAKMRIKKSLGKFKEIQNNFHIHMVLYRVDHQGRKGEQNTRNLTMNGSHIYTLLSVPTFA